MPLRLDTSSPDFSERFAAFLGTKREVSQDVAQAVAAIIDEVRARGDAALVDLSRKFDRVDLARLGIRVSEAEIEAAVKAADPATVEALAFAHDRIRSHHARQLPESGRYVDTAGVELGHRWTPVDAVGLYVPGGTAAYPSSVLMNAVPAKVAGVPEVIMVTPTPDGTRNPIVLAAAAIAGVDRAYAIGGAQAVAALAYGTQTLQPVDKIVGPGNAYVAAAKRRVFGTVGIDMIAGPSEILVICDGTTPADWIAMDLFSQAEHDELAQAILLCPDAAFLDAVQQAIERLLPAMPREAIIRASLSGRGALVQVRSLDEACEIANRIAPEHLEISTEEPERWAARIRHAGAIFMGRYSSEALGDYCAGPNHVLPTSRTARFSSPLGVYDFQKRSSLIQISREGAQQLGRLASTLAHGEGLQAHAGSAEYRLDER